VAGIEVVETASEVRVDVRLVVPTGDKFDFLDSRRGFADVELEQALGSRSVVDHAGTPVPRR